MRYILNEVKAPKKEDIAIPIIKSEVISVPFFLDDNLNISNITATDVINPDIPYIISGSSSIKAITAPKVALADIPII